MSMTLKEVDTEIGRALEAADSISTRYSGKDMPNEDRDELKRLLTQVSEHETARAGLVEVEDLRDQLVGARDRHSAPVKARRPIYGEDDDASPARRFSPGKQFVEDRGYRELKHNGSFNSALSRVEFAVQMADGTSLLNWATSQKALLRGGSTSSGGSFVLEDHQPGYIDILQREINVLDLVPRSPTTSDTIEYVKEDTFTNSSAFTAEATGFTATTLGGTGVKPESALAYSTSTSPVKTEAAWIPVTNRMLADAPAIRSIIDGRLLLGLTLTLETQVVSGDGSGENLTGIFNTGSIGAVSKGTDSIADALYKGRTYVRNTGHGRPSAYLINPTDWQTVRLSRESAATATPGTYLFGPPSQVGATTLWGLPVVESEAVPVGKAIIADWAQAMTLFDREQGSVRVGTINDQFIRNIQTVLAELRVAFVVWRPTCIAQVTGL
jgi:HK97 family phage major capsid protein